MCDSVKQFMIQQVSVPASNFSYPYF